MPWGQRVRHSPSRSGEKMKKNKVPEKKKKVASSGEVGGEATACRWWPGSRTLVAGVWGAGKLTNVEEEEERRRQRGGRQRSSCCRQKSSVPPLPECQLAHWWALLDATSL
jgi:hypothetical protein